jgi:hypothetical protein
VSAGAPWHSLGEVRETEDQLEIALANTGAIVILPICSVAVLAFAFAGRFALSFILALTIPLALLTVTWSVSYREPVAERRITFFGRLLSTRKFPLSHGDLVSTVSIKDSFLLVVRPRWYELTLWSSEKQTNRVIMKSNDKDELERMAVIFNKALNRSLSARAS